MKRIILKHGEEGRIRTGHPWVYDNEVAKILEGFAGGKGSGLGDSDSVDLLPGEIADVESSRKEYLGRALVNPNSKIIARIYSPSKEGMDKGFFKRRIREAVNRRTLTGSNFDLHRESARLVFAEADFLPGLIVDRFVGWPLKELESAVSLRPITFDLAEAALGPPRSWLAVQFLVYGMDSRREEILATLEEVLEQDGFIIPGDIPLGKPAGIVEKSAAKVRELEGLPLQEGLVRGDFPAEGIVIFENGFPFMLNLIDGQKTGHFLDQKDNHRAAAAYVQSAGSSTLRVLDAFSYTGGFGIHAGMAGAAQVTCVDASAPALETVRINAALNGVGDRVTAVEADVFEYLRTAERQKEQFDLIILDPPAFAKTRSALEGALRGYKEINLRAINMLKPGGVLVSCSCSHALDEIRFRYMITEAAADAGKRLIMLDFRRQPTDHPALVGYEESLYLKCGIYRVVG
ncbi:class I SAM-dependent rRNA methyltransferase [Treponema primitia]|uniref:class I SAM-dependent rRNA methyltransferase n=1 Tax=Treponema primitia TaxID=88058 RepID=UPI00025551C9|nr:class I SAM-dependent rRNA methyltransferase [Treponema primitia]